MSDTGHGFIGLIYPSDVILAYVTYVIDYNSLDWVIELQRRTKRFKWVLDQEQKSSKSVLILNLEKLTMQVP